MGFCGLLQKLCECDFSVLHMPANHVYKCVIILQGRTSLLQQLLFLESLLDLVEAASSKERLVSLSLHVAPPIIDTLRFAVTQGT
jgi:hypothetical protein